MHFQCGNITRSPVRCVFLFFHPPPFLLDLCAKPTIQAPHRHPPRYLKALIEQPHARILPAPLDTLIPVTLFVLGQTFVVTSTWALGITGTFLGDYFGILMDDRVEGFPFNVLRDPMYVGSTMCFAATALWCVSGPAYMCGRRHVVWG